MAIPHNSKCRYGERGAADAKPKTQIILDAAKVSAASGGNSEPKQGRRSQSARGFCPRSTMRVPQPDIIEHFGSADAVPQLPERCLSRKAGIVRCCLILKAGSSLFPKICRSYFLFTPHGLGDFLDQFELVPLFQLGQLVADLTGGKAALRAQAKTVEQDILFCLMDAGDYKAFSYPNGAVVIDNPPYYRGLPDHLRKRRKGKTSFVTSYSGGIVAQTAPDLTKAINRENDRLIKANTKELQKYDYPINVITAAMMQRYARYGVDLKIRADGCIQVGSLDAQKQAGKSIFGSGLLLCERAAAERAVVRWELSDREKAIIQQLG